MRNSAFWQTTICLLGKEAAGILGYRRAMRMGKNRATRAVAP
jgi:hypothetical protein